MKNSMVRFLNVMSIISLLGSGFLIRVGPKTTDKFLEFIRLILSFWVTRFRCSKRTFRVA